MSAVSRQVWCRIHFGREQMIMELDKKGFGGGGGGGGREKRQVLHVFSHLIHVVCNNMATAEYNINVPASYDFLRNNLRSCCERCLEKDGYLY